MKDSNVRVKEFVLDLHLFEKDGNKQVTDIDHALEEIAKFVKDNANVRELVLCHGTTLLPGTSLGLLIDAIRLSSLKRLSFQDILIRSSWAFESENLGVEQLELFACQFKDSLTLEKIIVKNKDLKVLVVQDTVF